MLIVNYLYLKFARFQDIGDSGKNDSFLTTESQVLTLNSPISVARSMRCCLVTPGRMTPISNNGVLSPYLKFAHFCHRIDETLSGDSGKNDSSPAIECRVVTLNSPISVARSMRHCLVTLGRMTPIPTAEFQVLTLNSPVSVARSMRHCLVTPGRMTPISNGGVTSSFSPSSLIQNMNTFIVPTSVN